MKKSSFYLIAIPIILLIFSISIKDKSDDKFAANDFNPFLETLPLKYIDLLNKSKENDSTFFHAIVDTKSSRELIVFKLFPTVDQLKTNFLIKLFPYKNTLQDNVKTPLSLSLTNSGNVYNYNNKTYGVFRIDLPYVNIKRLFIRPFLNEKEKNWKKTIYDPFTKIETAKATQVKNTNNKTNPSPYKILFQTLQTRYNLEYLPYSLKTIKDSLYEVNSGLSNYVSNKKLTIGTVKNNNLFWQRIENKSNQLLKSINFKGKNSNKANKLLQLFTKDSLTLNKTFNLEKLAYYFALNNLFTTNCEDKLYFIYNLENNNLEPFFVNSKCFGEVSDYLKAPKINDNTFLDLYLKANNEISNINIQEEIINIEDALFKQQTLINNYYPEYVFNTDILDINKRIIKKSINPSTAIKPEIISVSKEKIVFSVLNMSNYTVTINELNHLTKKRIIDINPQKQILSGSRDTISIDLPRSFENLFVSKKKKITGFRLYKHINELYLGYYIAGIDKKYFSTIIPYQEKETLEKDLFRNKTVINNHKDILIDKVKGIVTFTKKNIVISSPLIIPKNYVFKIKKGTTIDIVEGGKVISYAPLNFKGTEQEPIKVFSSDKKGQGFLVLSDGMTSQLDFVVFDHLTNLEHGFWNVSGAVTFYESPVVLNYVTVSNNRCEDALNIVRTTFEMNNCTISNTQSDAFDGDFVKGTINSSTFKYLGNDAIDVSGSDLIITNVKISDAGDKGLSAGENSKMLIKHVIISNSEIAVAGKDLSVVTIDDLNIINTKLGFTAFQKKPEFGPSQITVNNIKKTGVEMDYLVESTSTLTIDGNKMKTSENVKDRMYGVEFGVSSKETRNSK